MLEITAFIGMVEIFAAERWPAASISVVSRQKTMSLLERWFSSGESPVSKTLNEGWGR